MKTALSLILIVAIAILTSSSPSTKAQQNYTGDDQSPSCNNGNNNNESSSLYKCNGLQSSCKAFLLFTSKSPFNNVPMIASLTSSDHDELAAVNDATRFAVFSEGRPVVVPVNCSCSGGGRRRYYYYQASTAYQLSAESETYFQISNELFQGLSTCGSIERSNADLQESGLSRGVKVRVPLLCACPTKRQVEGGVRFLLTYPIVHGDTVYALSRRFNVSLRRLKEANCFDVSDPMIYPLTTILIPLEAEPSMSNTTACDSCKRNASSPLRPIPVDPRKESNGAHSKKYKLFFLLIILLVIAIVVPYVYYYYYHKRTPVGIRKDPSKEISSQSDLILEIAKLDRPVRVFRFAEVKKATKGFRSKNRIKGCVYRGDFKREVLAVKKHASQETAENELKMLQKINHFNIVKLQGFSKHDGDGVYYLVYEYMKRGSLRRWLGDDRSNDLNELINIALDVSNALMYLHSFTNPAYVHNNVTSDNILLDGNMRAKIGNFSHARTANFPSETKVVGDGEGYMAPEYFESCDITTKVDVFAFGVVLLEMATGKEAVFVEDGEERLLITAVGDIMGGEDSEAKLGRMVEPGLCGSDGGFRFAAQMVGLGLSCLRQDPKDRPSMVEIVSALQKMQSNMNKTVQ